MNLLKLSTKLPIYKISKKFNISPPTPFNLTISITRNCNSKCKTCKIWKDKKTEDLSLNEIEGILRSIGDKIFWITISGGEPFLREDIVKIVEVISKYNKPKIITIPTNGILTKKIVDNIKGILKFYEGRLIINISIDEIKKEHDNIRGVKCFDNALKTYKLLKKINNKKLSVGIHTVISKYNVKRFKEIYVFVKSLYPDSFIVEIAEKRKEMLNIKDIIEPSFEDYNNIISFLKKNKIENKGIFKITQFLKTDYYKSTIRVLNEKKQIMPCYAGIASAHIKANGDVVACCIKEKILGNLRNDNFRNIWNSKKANSVRQNIKNKECFCTLANVYYSNKICEIL